MFRCGHVVLTICICTEVSDKVIKDKRKVCLKGICSVKCTRIASICCIQILWNLNSFFVRNFQNQDVRLATSLTLSVFTHKIICQYTYPMYLRIHLQTGLISWEATQLSEVTGIPKTRLVGNIRNPKRLLLDFTMINMPGGELSCLAPYTRICIIYHWVKICVQYRKLSARLQWLN